jgi:hypothetical protein
MIRQSCFLHERDFASVLRQRLGSKAARGLEICRFGNGENILGQFRWRFSPAFALAALIA